MYSSSDWPWNTVELLKPGKKDIERMLQQVFRCFFGKEGAFAVLYVRHEIITWVVLLVRCFCKQRLERPWETTLICNLAPMLSWALTRSSDPAQLHPAAS